MIYFCADDYGLCEKLSNRIKQCVNEGALNKVSIFPNFENVDLGIISPLKDVRFSLHLNLVEGKSVSEDKTLNLITDENGNFKNTFGGLLITSLLKSKEFKKQIYKEIKAQVMFWKNSLPENTAFCIDSHQHTHMIPSVFKTLLNVLKEENIAVDYLRIPVEPIIPFIKEPSLYFTYNIVNLIKQWLLKFLWQFNKKLFKTANISTAYFFGVLFSGRMDEKRVNKILPQYIKLAEKNNKDIEVLLHPGYLKKDELNFKEKSVVFEKFYLSENRKIEFDTAMRLIKKEV